MASKVKWTIEMRERVIKAITNTLKVTREEAESFIKKPPRVYSNSNETTGQSAEHALCSLMNIHCSIAEDRIDAAISKKIQGVLTPYIDETPLCDIESSIGFRNGAVDFQLKGGKTLSLKTLKRSDGKICPQNVGQSTLKKWDEHWGFYKELEGKLEHNSKRFKYIKANLHHYLNVMLDNTFCCDYLLLLPNCHKTPSVEFLQKPPTTPFFVDQTLSFKEGREIYFERWDEKKQKYCEFSSTVYMGQGEEKKRVGEFQFHKGSRKEVKFRFYREFLTNY